MAVSSVGAFSCAAPGATKQQDEDVARPSVHVRSHVLVLLRLFAILAARWRGVHRDDRPLPAGVPPLSDFNSSSSSSSSSSAPALQTVFIIVDGPKYAYKLFLRSPFFEHLRETLCRRNAVELLEAARLVFVLIYDNLLFYISVQTAR